MGWLEKKFKKLKKTKKPKTSEVSMEVSLRSFMMNQVERMAEDVNEVIFLQEDELDAEYYRVKSWMNYFDGWNFVLMEGEEVLI